ncbi:MAG: DUF5672 family protein, partial [Nanoarchaeota archaeon]
NQTFLIVYETSHVPFSLFRKYHTLLLSSSEHLSQTSTQKKYNKILILQFDGFLIKKGWENLCSKYSYLGAKWKEKIQVIENTFNFGPIQVGNGGFSYREKDKTLQILDLINFSKSGQKNIVHGLKIYKDDPVYSKGYWLAEDILFCYFGFGAGIYNEVPLEIADQFSLEPITLEQYNNKISMGFHRIDE